MVMSTLNKYGKEAIDQVGGVNSLTDITGFGLLGHALEMAMGSNVSIKIYHKNIPVITNALEYASMGLVPAGAYANREYVGDNVIIDENVPQNIEDILYDPQTSGGLLISIAKDKADLLLEKLTSIPTKYAVVGEVIEKQEHYLYVK